MVIIVKDFIIKKTVVMYWKVFIMNIGMNLLLFKKCLKKLLKIVIV